MDGRVNFVRDSFDCIMKALAACLRIESIQRTTSPHTLSRKMYPVKI